MSDAKTAAEIEDILSSIRRLVSQDRKASAQSGVSSGSGSAPQRPQILSRLVVEDRLILTPAQRVAAPSADLVAANVTPLRREATRATPQAQSQAQSQAWPEGKLAAEARPAGQTTGLGAAVSASPVGASASGSAVAEAGAKPATAQGDRKAAQDTGSLAAFGAADTVHAAVDPQSVGSQSVDPQSVETKSVEPLSAGPRLVLSEPSASSTEPEAMGRLHLDSPILTPDALAWESELGDPAPDLASLDWSSFTFARRPMAETYAARSRAAERLTAERLTAERLTAAQGATPAAQKAAAPVAPAPIAVAQEPVARPASQPPAEALSDEFHLRRKGEAQAAPLDLAAAPQGAEPVEEPILQEEDSIFSEDVLRELVRDLIREQLQGDLGERITRNIRKLIKAEIARAITVQDLQ